MNFYELLEAVKDAPKAVKDELIDRFYNNERIVVQAMLKNKFSSQEERRKDGIER